MKRLMLAAAIVATIATSTMAGNITPAELGTKGDNYDEIIWLLATANIRLVCGDAEKADIGKIIDYAVQNNKRGLLKKIMAEMFAMEKDRRFTCAYAEIKADLEMAKLSKAESTAK